MHVALATALLAVGLAAAAPTVPPLPPACEQFKADIGVPLAADHSGLVLPAAGLDVATRQRLHGLFAAYPGASFPESCAVLEYYRLAELLAADAAASGDAVAQAEVTAAAWRNAVAAAAAPICPTLVMIVHAKVLQRLAAYGWLALPPQRLAALETLVVTGLPALRAQISAGWRDGSIGPAEERALADGVRAHWIADVLANP